MTVSRWLSIINTLLIGIVIGWMLRMVHTDDRYLTAKAALYETEAVCNFYSIKDQQIQQNKGDIANERTTQK